MFSGQRTHTIPNTVPAWPIWQFPWHPYKPPSGELDFRGFSAFLNASWKWCLNGRPPYHSIVIQRVLVIPGPFSNFRNGMWSYKVWLVWPICGVMVTKWYLYHTIDICILMSLCIYCSLHNIIFHVIYFILYVFFMFATHTHTHRNACICVCSSFLLCIHLFLSLETPVSYGLSPSKCVLGFSITNCHLTNTCYYSYS